MIDNRFEQLRIVNHDSLLTEGSVLKKIFYLVKTLILINLNMEPR